MNFSDLPDWQHIENIKTRLWFNREYGQASVMIGAGFSRNAEKVYPNVPLFPLWGEIAGQMFDKLYPINNFSSKADYDWEKSKMLSGSLVLRLASEYEFSFGRLAVDDLLIETIPDNSYQPGQLHRLILSLPWSDVFTTNYDTLLERTQPFIHERKYDVIRTIQEIPGRMKPRIVKLHGSFPAHRPFILTEDDFRTYPTQFSPFVNMVQQSMMENAFCLVGFSGDDPNFLSWSGWIRDRLGNSVAPIYLCGIFDHSPSLKKLLERRNIITIDLAPVLQNANIHDRQLRHSVALEWFLQALKSGKQDDQTDWLRDNNEKTWTSQYDLPKLPIREYQTRVSHSFGHNRTLQVEELQNIIIEWRKDRENYPGWLVMPHDEREELWRITEHLIEPVLNGLNNLSPPDDISLLYELNWRLERTLTPIAGDWLEKYLEILEKYNPFPNKILQPSQINPEKNEYRNLNWTDLIDKWVEIAFAVVRKLREDFDERFNNWMFNINQIKSLKTDWQDHWYYEQSLFYLFHFDEDKLRKTLNDWNTVSTDRLEWKIKRSSLLAELGDIITAQRLAEESLNEVRSRYQPYKVDHSLLSHEPWIMMLLNSLNFSLRDLGDDFPDSDRSRWQWLKNQGYDPWNFVKQLNLSVKLINKDDSPDIEIIEGFDPGHITISSKFGHEPKFVQILPAFAALRLYEDCSLPIRISYRHVNSNTPIDNGLASQKISELSPMWALSMMIRAGKDKELAKWFDRTRIATLNNIEVDRLFNLNFGIFTQAIQKLSTSIDMVRGDESFYRSSIKLITDLLSRLIFRLSVEQRDKVLETTLSLYEQPFIRSYPFISDIISPLFRRCFYAMTDEEILNRFKELLSLPVPDEAGFNVPKQDEFVNPFRYIKWKDLKKIPVGFDRSVWNVAIASLIRIVRFGAVTSRKHAISRLISVHNIEGLTESELRDFYEALWSKLDGNGLPDNTNLYYSALLFLAPSDEVENVKAKLRQLFLSDTFPQQKDYIDECANCSLWAAVPEDQVGNYIDWTEDESIMILNKALQSIRNEMPPSIKEENKGIFGKKDNKKRVRDFLRLLRQTILPRISVNNFEQLKTINDVLHDLEKLGYKVSSVKPSCLNLVPEQIKQVSQEIRASINSIDEDESSEATLAIYMWLLLNAKNNIPLSPPDLFKEIINKVRFRRHPGLDFALDYLSLIIRKRILQLDDEMIKDICFGLEYLIEDTKLIEQSWQQSYESTTIKYEKRYFFRALSARLAKNLQDYLVEIGKEIPEVLLKWEEIRKTDCLPEVRFAGI